MISINSESLIPLSEVPQHLPRRPGGKKIHVSTVFRWALRGCNGTRLETCQVGSLRYTSVEALGRFVERRSAPEADERPRHTSRRVTGARGQAMDAALDANGL